jgi:hypothetical protein
MSIDYFNRNVTNISDIVSDIIKLKKYSKSIISEEGLRYVDNMIFDLNILYELLHTLDKVMEGDRDIEEFLNLGRLLYKDE